MRDVFVDGEKVVEAGRVLTLNHAEALGLLADAQARMEADVPNHDWAHRRAEDIAPLSLPLGSNRDGADRSRDDTWRGWWRHVIG